MTDHRDSPLLIQIAADVAAIKNEQAATSKRLFGNGQPGELDRLDLRIKTLELKEAKEEGEKSSNTRWAGYVAAAVSAVMWGIQMLVKFIHNRN